jgi:hypothetical protein
MISFSSCFLVLFHHGIGVEVSVVFGLPFPFYTSGDMVNKKYVLLGMENALVHH